MLQQLEKCKLEQSAFTLGDIEKKIFKLFNFAASKCGYSGTTVEYVCVIRSIIFCCMQQKPEQVRIRMLIQTGGKP